MGERGIDRDHQIEGGNDARGIAEAVDSGAKVDGLGAFDFAGCRAKLQAEHGGTQFFRQNCEIFGRAGPVAVRIVRIERLTGPVDADLQPGLGRDIRIGYSVDIGFGEERHIVDSRAEQAAHRDDGGLAIVMR